VWGVLEGEVEGERVGAVCSVCVCANVCVPCKLNKMCEVWEAK